MVSLRNVILEAPSGPDLQEETLSPLALGSRDEPQPWPCLLVALYFLSLLHPLMTTAEEVTIRGNFTEEPKLSLLQASQPNCTMQLPNPLLWPTVGVEKPRSSVAERHHVPASLHTAEFSASELPGTPRGGDPALLLTLPVVPAP